MDAWPAPVALLFVALVPGCTPLVAGAGAALVGTALVLAGWLLARLMRGLRHRLGVPDALDPRGPRLPGQTLEDIAARLRHDSPGGWTAGETRWTLAHQRAWFSSSDYRTFLLAVFVVVASWSFGLHLSHQLCP